MITCRQLAELLFDYIAGELPPEQADVIRKHLCECPPCVAYVETYQLTIKLTRQLPPAPVPPQLIERLKSAMQQGGGEAHTSV
jgi:anti-sigma factor RsiW